VTIALTPASFLGVVPFRCIFRRWRGSPNSKFAEKNDHWFRRHAD